MKTYFARIHQILEGHIFEMTIWEWVDGEYQEPGLFSNLDIKDPNVELKGSEAFAGSAAKIRTWTEAGVEKLSIFVYKT